MPEDFREQRMGTVGALVDGKDFATDTTRQQTAMTRAMRSDKISHSGARCNTWTTSAGLTFEHTALFMARDRRPTCCPLEQGIGQNSRRPRRSCGPGLPQQGRASLPKLQCPADSPLSLRPRSIHRRRGLLGSAGVRASLRVRDQFLSRDGHGGLARFHPARLLPDHAGHV